MRDSSSLPRASLNQLLTLLTTPPVGRTASLRSSNSLRAASVLRALSTSGWLLSRVFALFAIIRPLVRSEEHTSELQSLMRISYAVFCLQKKKRNTMTKINHQINLHMNEYTYAILTTT